MLKKKNAFTIIEILVALTIVAIVLIIGFQSYMMILAGKVKLIERTNLEKEAFFFSERLFQMIKQGGTLDYEEYFNRKVIGLDIENGHYSSPSGFGNFGPGGLLGNGVTNFGLLHPYICRSTDLSNGGIKYNGDDKCYLGNSDIDIDPLTGNDSGTGSQEHQRYGQYKYMFWDYNSNTNSDLGDEDEDGNIMGDDDDEDLGIGPELFTQGTDIHELYLLSGNKRTRTFFRWKFESDPDAIGSSGPLGCDTTKIDPIDEGCRGTLQFLQLEARDWGWDHDNTNSGTDPYENDGILDTWLIDKKFRHETNCKGSDLNYDGKKDEYFVAGQFDTESCWKDLFPESLNVSNFKVYAFPNQNQELAWKIEQSKIVSPYVILSLEIRPSWAIKRKIRGEIPPIKFNTTVNLTEIFSK